MNGLDPAAVFETPRIHHTTDLRLILGDDCIDDLLAFPRR